MTEHKITLAAGATKVLHTAGMYCDRDIVVTADGGGKREGTAIPVGKHVGQFYFNTAMPFEETMTILSQPTYSDVAGSTAYLIYADVDEEYNGHLFFAMKENGYTLLAYAQDITLTKVEMLFSDVPDPNLINGWCTTEVNVKGSGSFAQVLINGIVTPEKGEILTEFMGVPIGAENEKIKNVLSITPF